MFEQVDQFYAQTTPPNDLEKKRNAFQSFIATQQSKNRRVVLVTSGGTTVPLEKATVRFVDNFSVGTRGAISAEEFLARGYAVIFLYRQYSLQPYHRHFSHAERGLLDHLHFNWRGRVDVLREDAAAIYGILKEYKAVLAEERLLTLSFVTVVDYLFLLREAARALHPLGSNALLYLAAAVSDFYLPESKMAEHKIQSSDGGLRLELDQVPKMLKVLKLQWAPNAFVVSFKLETDSSLLIRKSCQSLDRYNHQLVIGNLLLTRKHSVTFVFPNHSTEEITLTKAELAKDADSHIESKIIPRLAFLHHQFINQTRHKSKL